MITKDTIKTVIIVADIASFLILAYIIFKSYLTHYSYFNLSDAYFTILPLFIIKFGEIILRKNY